MKRQIKIASIMVVATVVLLVVVNQLLWAQSYAYACWRVRHPFGPNAQAFARVVSKTRPVHIPELIARVDGPDGWWIESMFRAWFPEAQPPGTDRQIYWNKWWQNHRLEHGATLVLHHDPQF